MAVQVGEFPGIKKRRKMNVRAIPNPLDKATIVSIFPAVLDEFKPTIFPGRFQIPAGSPDKPVTTVITPASAFIEISESMPAIEMSNSAVVIADSIIKDYCSGLLACDMDTRRPGLFFVAGEVELPDIIRSYKGELSKALQKQKAWFLELVKLGDGLWAKYNGNPMVIWDMMRLAAKDLGMMDKPWLQYQLAAEKVKCLACGGLKDPAYPVCPTCKAVDPNHPLAKEIKFAQ